jgi:glycine dehydrogenase subunit 2
MSEKLIFEHSAPGRSATAQYPDEHPAAGAVTAIPEALRRRAPPVLPEVSELQAVRHYTRLSQLNFSIDTHFYPLGSCTMKYNPRACNQYAMLPEFLGRHPLAPDSTGQGVMQCLWELQEMLKAVTGMRGVSLTPMAGAQGEFAGVAMIRAYHRARGDGTRSEIIVPDAAHGTNPATATMCGCTVHEIPSLPNGDIDLDALRAAVEPQTAGIMLTNPSTLGVFERRIHEVADIVHKAGGLLYYDGANLNAILGKVRPGDMGFDVIHMNLHKTFSTPHGGGGPGSGAVGVSERLLPYMPVPVVGREGERFRWLDEGDLPQTIGRLSAFAGNTGVLLRAYHYGCSGAGMHRVSGRDITQLSSGASCKAGLDLSGGRASHNSSLAERAAREHGTTAMDFEAPARLRLYAPATYFPLLVPGVC